jgi:enamine deaminase RidA (YjgF/YER057c/UK114 family)
MSVDERLRELAIELPAPIQPLGSYCTFVEASGLLFLSGHVPVRDGQMVHVGKLGRELTVEQGQEAARFTALNCLATLRAALGSLERVQRVVRLTGFVNSAAGFNQQAAVLNGASDLLGTVFGPRGVHVRSAVGAAELPGDAAVELELTVQVSSA